MALGIWHFTAKSHVDVKCVYSRFGNIVSDTTVRKALNSMTGSSLVVLWDSVKDATSRGETEWCLVLDNVQEYCPIYEGGIARQSILKVGTAGTAIRLDDCRPGAFDLQSHLTRVAQKKRKTMTVETLRIDIDWTHESRTRDSITTLGSGSRQLHSGTQVSVQRYFSQVSVGAPCQASHAWRKKDYGTAVRNQCRERDWDPRDGTCDHGFRWTDGYQLGSGKGYAPAIAGIRGREGGASRLLIQISFGILKLALNLTWS